MSSTVHWTVPWGPCSVNGLSAVVVAAGTAKVGSGSTTAAPGAPAAGGRRPSRAGRRAGPAQLPLSWPRARRDGASPPADRAIAPTVDLVAAVAALGAALGAPAASLTRLGAPAGGWPDALVGPGDAVLVAAGAPVADGALAAVRLRASGAVHVRRVHPAGPSSLRLQPESRGHAPLIVPAADVELLGPVVTIARAAVGTAQAGRRSA